MSEVPNRSPERTPPLLLSRPGGAGKTDPCGFFDASLIFWWENLCCDAAVEDTILMSWEIRWRAALALLVRKFG